MVFADLKDIRPALVFSGDRLVNEPVGGWPELVVDETAVRNTVNVDWNTIGESTFQIPASGDQTRVTDVIEGQVTIEHRIECYRGAGNVALGFIQDFSPQKGALARSVAHDHPQYRHHWG